MPNRRDGGPRLIGWDGTRVVPWAPDRSLVLAHFHRYRWARDLALGRIALDVGCGEGYGPAILNESAASVFGVDSDGGTILHARAAYDCPGLLFEPALANHMVEFEDGRFTLVTAFDLLPHVADQENVVEEIRRVLAGDGILAVSSPREGVHLAPDGGPAPFHERDLKPEELRRLVGRQFEHVALFGQVVE